jgi:hypothetical protein
MRKSKRKRRSGEPSKRLPEKNPSPKLEHAVKMNRLGTTLRPLVVVDLVDQGVLLSTRSSSQALALLVIVSGVRFGIPNPRNLLQVQAFEGVSKAKRRRVRARSRQSSKLRKLNLVP